MAPNGWRCPPSMGLPRLSHPRRAAPSACACDRPTDHGWACTCDLPHRRPTMGGFGSRKAGGIAPWGRLDYWHSQSPYPARKIPAPRESSCLNARLSHAAKCPCFALRVSHCSAYSFAVTFVRADAPRVLAAGKLPSDSRLQPLKNLNGYFPLEVPATREAWEERAKQLRRQILVAEGLWPMPDKTPANAVIHGKVDRDGYTVERVLSREFSRAFRHRQPYRPKGKSGKLPAVLSPHGHWANGRFYRLRREADQKDLVERRRAFRSGGRIRFNRRAHNWRGWAAWCFITTWSAMATAFNSNIAPAFARR